MFLLTKKLDYKGRVLIPKVVLDKAGFKPGDYVSFEITKANGIVIRRVIKDDISDEDSLDELIIND